MRIDFKNSFRCVGIAKCIGRQKWLDLQSNRLQCYDGKLTKHSLSCYLWLLVSQMLIYFPCIAAFHAAVGNNISTFQVLKNVGGYYHWWSISTADGYYQYFWFWGIPSTHWMWRNTICTSHWHISPISVVNHSIPNTCKEVHNQKCLHQTLSGKWA